MHYLPFGARLNKGILMVTQLNSGFSPFYINLGIKNQINLQISKI